METTGFDLEVFQTHLEETLAWYLAKAPIADPQHDLRTAALAPSANLAHPWSDFPAWTNEMRREKYRARTQAPHLRQAIVDEVARKRRALLSVSYLDHPQRAAVLGRGRLLTYEPEQNMYDGAAENASEGFFEVDNVPPWDLWLMYVVEDWQQPTTYLLAWVPPECLKLASTGIEVNPEQCIRWAEDVDAAFVRHLRGAGLLR